jgi:hypothetical protein
MSAAPPSSDSNVLGPDPDPAATLRLLGAALGTTDELLGGHAHLADTCSKIARETVLAVVQLVDGPLSVAARRAGAPRLDIEATTAQATARATTHGRKK